MNAATNARDIDGTGKIILDDIYDASDPASYYLTLGRLDYVIPEAARAVFVALIDAIRKDRALERVKILDIGSSYGVNAAILKYDVSFSQLTARYAAKRAEGLSGGDLMRDDRALFDALEEVRPIDVIGLDVSRKAVAYAESAHILDAGLVRDFEQAPLDAPAKELLADVDLVISTGAVGYVTALTFEKVVSAARRRPWIASFVLRQFDFAPIAKSLAAHGYESETLDNLAFPQRRFADATERDGAFKRLAAIGRERTALEDNGWYASTLHLARPSEEARGASLEALLKDAPLPAAAEV